MDTLKELDGLENEYNAVFDSVPDKFTKNRVKQFVAALVKFGRPSKKVKALAVMLWKEAQKSENPADTFQRGCINWERIVMQEYLARAGRQMVQNARSVKFSQTIKPKL